MNKILSLFLALCIFSACSSGQKLPTKTKKEKKAELYYNHGTSALLRKDYTDALDKLLKALELQPKNSKVHNNLGMAYFFKNRYNQAEVHMKKAFELDPKNSDARVNLASLYYRQGKFSQAKEIYLQVLNDLVYRHQYRTHYNLALIYLKERNIAEAKRSLNESIKIREDYCVAYFTLGGIARQQKNHIEALDWYKKGTQGTCHNEPAAHYQQAISYIDLREYEKAALKLEEVSDRFPKSQYSSLASLKLREVKDSNFLTQSMVENLEIQKIKRLINKSPTTEKDNTIQSPSF